MKKRGPKGSFVEPGIVVSVGTGGVGKTTVSTVLAMNFARSGYKTLVLTIDPARRLKGLLNLDGGGGEHRVSLPDSFPGELWAALLDVELTLETAVRNYGDPRQIKSVLDHRIYRMLVTSLSGMQELMALEYLDQALKRGYEAVVIDTAPSRHAFEFLDKPEYFAELVSYPFVKIASASYRIWSASPFGRIGRRSLDVYARLEELVGVGVVGQVLDFYGLFRSIAEGYARRARKTAAILRDPARTDFFVVTVPDKAERDVDFFERELQARSYPRPRTIINRCWPAPPKDLSPTNPHERRVLDWGSAVVDEQEKVLERLAGRSADVAPPLMLRELPTPVDGMSALEKLLEEIETF
jgi:anion-transporting  ArsA/GET3 family ATPase